MIAHDVGLALAALQVALKRNNLDPVVEVVFRTDPTYEAVRDAFQQSSHPFDEGGGRYCETVCGIKLSSRG